MVLLLILIHVPKCLYSCMYLWKGLKSACIHAVLSWIFKSQLVILKHRPMMGKKRTQTLVIHSIKNSSCYCCSHTNWAALTNTTGKFETLNSRKMKDTAASPLTFMLHVSFYSLFSLELSWLDLTLALGNLNMSVTVFKLVWFAPNILLLMSDSNVYLLCLSKVLL